MSITWYNVAELLSGSCLGFFFKGKQSLLAVLIGTIYSYRLRVRERASKGDEMGESA